MKLYNFEEANEIMDKVGLSRHERKDERNFRQFCKEGSSLHVKTKIKKQFELYSTAVDFNNIKNELFNSTRNYVVLNDISDKNKLEEILNELKSLDKKLIVMVTNGNRKCNPGSAENELPHEIVFFDNDSFDFVVNVLALNLYNKA